MCGCPFVAYKKERREGEGMNVNLYRDYVLEMNESLFKQSTNPLIIYL